MSLFPSPSLASSKRPPDPDSDKPEEEQASQKRIRVEDNQEKSDSAQEESKMPGAQVPQVEGGVALGAETGRGADGRSSQEDRDDAEFLLADGSSDREQEGHVAPSLFLEGNGVSASQSGSAHTEESADSELESEYEAVPTDESSSESDVGESDEEEDSSGMRRSRRKDGVPSLDEMVQMMRDMERFDMNRWLDRHGHLPVSMVLRTIAVLAPSLLPPPVLPLLLSGTGRSASPDSASSASTSSGPRPYFGRRTLSETGMVKLLGSVLKEVCPRSRVEWVKGVEDVISLLRSSADVIVLAGAGISVNCGIPDFRSEDGIYARLKGRFGLKKPEDMFSLPLFLRRPDIFYSFAEEIYCAPGAASNRFRPGAAHLFFRLLSEKGRLRRVYTQNIDSLDLLAGVPKDKVVQCHGSFATASCVECGWQCEGSEIEDAVKAKRVPRCPVCPPKPTKVPPPDSNPPAFDESTLVEELVPPPLKPDIVFFGEQLPSSFHRLIQEDLPSCSVMLIIGTSLQVAPVSTMPKLLPPDIPAAVINKTLVKPGEFDVELLGDVDEVVGWLCKQLRWNGLLEELKRSGELPVEREQLMDGELGAAEGKEDRETSQSSQENIEDEVPYRLIQPNQYVFPGAVVGLGESGGKHKPGELDKDPPHTYSDDSDEET